MWRPAEPHDRGGRDAREEQKRGEQRERDQEAHEAAHVPPADVVAHELAKVVEALNVPVRVAREDVALARVVQLGRLRAEPVGRALLLVLAGRGRRRRRGRWAPRHARVHAHRADEEERGDGVHGERREGEVLAEPRLDPRRH